MIRLIMQKSIQILN